MNNNTANKIQLLHWRIRAILQTHLQEFLQPVNDQRIFADLQPIEFPDIQVGVDSISLGNLSTFLGQKNIVSVYPSSTQNVLDITGGSTERSVWTVEAGVFTTEQRAWETSSQAANVLSVAAAQCLETYLPTPNSEDTLCIYDTQIRERVGSKRLLLPTTTITGFACATRIEIYQRTFYQYSPSRLSQTIPFGSPNTELGNPPTLSFISSFGDTFTLSSTERLSRIPIGAFSGPTQNISIAISTGPNDADIHTIDLAQITKQNGTTIPLTLSFSQSTPKLWTASQDMNSLSLQPGDKLIVLWITNGNYPNTGIAEIIPDPIP